MTDLDGSRAVEYLVAWNSDHLQLASVDFYIYRCHRWDKSQTGASSSVGNESISKITIIGMTDAIIYYIPEYSNR